MISLLPKTDGINFAPASLAAGAMIMNAEFTNLEDSFNFQLNASG